MAIIGYNTIGGSWMGGAYADNIHLCKYTSAGAGNLSSMTMWLQDNGEKYRLAIYKASDYSLVEESAEFTTSGANAWQTATGFSAAVTAQDYYLAVKVATNNSGKSDAGAANQRLNNLHAYGAFPDPYSIIGQTTQAQKISIYATYSGGAPPPGATSTGHVHTRGMGFG